MPEQHLLLVLTVVVLAMVAFAYWGTRTPKNYRIYLDISVIGSIVGTFAVMVSIVVGSIL